MKNKNEAYEKLVEMSRNDNYATENLLDFSYHQKCYKFVGIDLSRQANTNIPQQINFTGTLEEDDGATVFYCWKVTINYSNFFFRFINCNNNKNWI